MGSLLTLAQWQSLQFHGNSHNLHRLLALAEFTVMGTQFTTLLGTQFIPQSVTTGVPGHGVASPAAPMPIDAVVGRNFRRGEERRRCDRLRDDDDARWRGGERRRDGEAADTRDGDP